MTRNQVNELLHFLLLPIPPVDARSLLILIKDEIVVSPKRNEVPRSCPQSAHFVCRIGLE